MREPTSNLCFQPGSPRLVVSHLAVFDGDVHRAEVGGDWWVLDRAGKSRYRGSPATIRVIALSCRATTCLSESTSVCSCAMSLLRPPISLAASFSACAMFAWVRGFVQPARTVAHAKAKKRNGRMAGAGSEGEVLRPAQNDDAAGERRGSISGCVGLASHCSSWWSS